MQRLIGASPASVSAGIRFGNYFFSEPVPLGGYASPEPSGLFAVLVPDPTWAPRPFQPLFFGEFSGAGPTRDDYLCWLRAAAGRHLYAAASRAPQGSAALRELVRAYDPLCNRNRSDAASGDVLQRLNALERKSQEHDAMMRVVFAAAAKMFEPLPEPRKRAIGFTS